MVAKSPTKQRRMAAALALNPNLVRETLNKVDQCMARLRELQYTVVGGAKVVSGVTLSPRSTKGYIKTSVRCKQESLRMKNNGAARRSPVGKFPASANGSRPLQTGEWRRMSLPAMLLGETVVEILQASQTAKEAFAGTAAARANSADPKTPINIRRANKLAPRESGDMQARRSKEKQRRLRIIRSESSPAAAASAASRARSRIRFKSNSPVSARRREVAGAAEQIAGGRHSVAAQWVSPRNRPWAKKTVLFPNTLFQPSSPTSSHGQGQQQHRQFYKTRSPIIGRARPQTPHKFVIKSPPTSQFPSKKEVAVRILKASPEEVAVLRARRRSFSPSKLVHRMASPLKSRIALPKLKKRPEFGTPVRIPGMRRLGAPDLSMEE